MVSSIDYCETMLLGGDCLRGEVAVVVAVAVVVVVLTFVWLIPNALAPY